jgi:7-cyano-7-deazaguanine synthase
MPKIKEKAVILLSGGIDSATTLYWAKDKYKCFCLIFDYNQRHKKEINCAVRLAKLNNCPYEIVKFNLPWKGSSLLDEKIPLPERSIKEIKLEKTPPSTYVPARNTIFLSFGISYAETIGANYILIGANAIDFSGYPDCKPEYYKEYNKLIKIGTKSGGKIKILTPLIEMTKAQIIRLGKELKVPYELTWSCYAGGDKPCQSCDSCKLRNKGFKEAGIKDPLFFKNIC